MALRFPFDFLMFFRSRSPFSNVTTERRRGEWQRERKRKRVYACLGILGTRDEISTIVSFYRYWFLHHRRWHRRHRFASDEINAKLFVNIFVNRALLFVSNWRHDVNLRETFVRENVPFADPINSKWCMVQIYSYSDKVLFFCSFSL